MKKLNEYQRFVKLNLPHYIRAGNEPSKAMKMVARDWYRWKMGIGNPYAYYVQDKLGRWRLIKVKPKKNIDLASVLAGAGTAVLVRKVREKRKKAPRNPLYLHPRHWTIFRSGYEIPFNYPDRYSAEKAKAWLEANGIWAHISEYYEYYRLEIDNKDKKRALALLFKKGLTWKNPEGLWDSYRDYGSAVREANRLRKIGWKVRIVELEKFAHDYNKLVKIIPKPKKNPESLYQAFHGNPPARIRKVAYEPPPKRLVKIGRLSQLNYIPEYPSKRARQEFYHRSGDTGAEVLKSNLILATDEKGRNLYLLKDKGSKYPKFTKRGIIG